MKKKGLTLIEVLATIGILSLLILTLISSAIFIVKSSDNISKSHIIKSKLAYHYFDSVFIPYFCSNSLYNVTSNQNVEYKKEIRKQIELNINRGRIYNNDQDIVPNLKAAQIFQSLRTRLTEDPDIKNWGIKILSVELKISDKYPISSVIKEEINGYKLTATLLWFDVIITYQTKDGRILTVKEELPLINNVDSIGIVPPGHSTTSPTSSTNTTSSIRTDYTDASIPPR